MEITAGAAVDKIPACHKHKDCKDPRSDHSSRWRAAPFTAVAVALCSRSL